MADTDRSNLMEFGRYVQEMLPKYIQQTQITFRFIPAQYMLYVGIYIYSERESWSLFGEFIHVGAIVFLCVLLASHPQQ